MSEWKVAKTPEGKEYYYRGSETTWIKPAELADAADDWVEAEQGGKKYYWNRKTKETRWDKPGAESDEPQIKQESCADDAGSGFVAGGGRGQRDYGAPDRRMDRRDGRHADLPQKPSGGAPWEGRFDGRQESRHESRHEGLGFRGPMPVKTDEPEYGSRESNEEAFFKCLRRHDISSDMSWSDALRQVVQDRDYRAIKDPLERQQAFQKYCIQIREQEKEEEQKRLLKLKDDFRQMLSTHDEIRHYTRWKTARPIIEREAVFKGSKNEALKRQLFEEYIRELQNKRENEEYAMRTDAKKDLEAIISALIHDPDTTWTAGREMIESNERYANEKKFRTLSQAEVLNMFDSVMRRLDREENDKKKKEGAGKIRRERKARDGFRQLLAEKRAEGLIKAGSKWKDLHAHIMDDERYQNLLATRGSSPHDLFLDVMEEEEGLLRSKRHQALDVLDDKRYEMTLETSLPDFAGVMKSEKRTSAFDDDEVGLIYERLMEKVKKRAEEDKAHAERHQRKAIDALRSVIKRLDPPVRATDSYADVAPRLQSVPEYQALEDEEARRQAFEKHIRRLKEKDDDLDGERTRRDRTDRGSSRRYDQRSDRGGRRTRSPEQNAYEADRRKAQADRERLHRRGSFGLSPPPRERERERDSYSSYRDGRDDRYRSRRDDRERDRDRYDGVYERERRERELERESARGYLSRADPRDVGVALHYGDEDEVGSGSRPGSVRKRRESDDNGRKREAKRRRRTPESNLVEPLMFREEKEDVALQSGSEEGEIEEV